MVCVASFKLMKGDAVLLPSGWKLATGGDLPLRDWILYKDTDYIVLNKPAGIASHSGPKHEISIAKSLTEITYSCPTPPRLLHRLSSKVSGALLLARHDDAAQATKDLMKKHAFWRRKFWAICTGGSFASENGTINVPLVRSSFPNRTNVGCVSQGGQVAITEWRRLKKSRSNGGLSLLELEPYTSISDQMRVHLAFGLRAPIVGDDIYRNISGWIGNIVDSSSAVRDVASRSEMDPSSCFPQKSDLHLHCREIRFCTFGGKYDFSNTL